MQVYVAECQVYGTDVVTFPRTALRADSGEVNKKVSARAGSLGTEFLTIFLKPDGQGTGEPVTVDGRPQVPQHLPEHDGVILLACARPLAWLV